MPGAEYVSVDTLVALWGELDIAARAQASAHSGGLAGWAHDLHPAWRRVGRVCFHLAENKNDPDRPFAFLATYVPGVSSGGKAKYIPLAKALVEYAGVKNKDALARLLSPVRAAAERSALAAELVDTGEVFHPLAWTPGEAYRFLKDIPLFESAGLAVRVPDWWKKRPRPAIKVTVAAKKRGVDDPTSLGQGAALSFDIQKALGDEEISEAEWRAMLSAGDGLFRLRGQWVEVDAEKLKAALAHWRKVERAVGDDGLSFLQGMRLLAGASDAGGGDENGGETAAGVADWSRVAADGAFAEALAKLRHPETAGAAHPGPALQATLRPYQEAGVAWLRFLARLGLGGCLADDMGLGKTIQVLALLLTLKKETPEKARRPSLAVLPASLLGNWKAEAERFAPSLKTLFLHPAFADAKTLASAGKDAEKTFRDYDVVFTSYGMAHRQPGLAEVKWRLAILDEAQAIKNPGARQTRFVKTLRVDARLALTGTPVENRLGDLWSLFDFLNPGLLGGAKGFAHWVGRMEKREHDPYAPLRALTGPYILRRLKTNPKVAGDLPAKTEVDAWCGLAKPQAALYARAVEELRTALSSAEPGIRRQGLVLGCLTRFKQLCNHPDQYSGTGDYAPDASGKFARLRALAEEFAARQEKCLVFTQFKEMTAPLARFLAGIYGRDGLVLHGATAVKERKKLVDDFQRDDGPPFFILSLKAGGTGLNLTAATQVVHFDRWWNPAVENQATDRAYRIGQKRNVLVHKFICRGTIEERIDALLKEKRKLADGVLEEGVARALTDMTDAELLKFVSLDARRAGAED